MYKALVNFTGLVSMYKGEIKEIKDKDIVKSLLKANYIVEVKDITDQEDTDQEDTDQEDTDKENQEDTDEVKKEKKGAKNKKTS